MKTVRFGQPKYVGDPINAVRIFNEKQVDELAVLDIDATVRSAEPSYSLIARLAAECRMPLCYGGGVRSPEQVQRIIALGVEKVALSAGVIDQPELIAASAERVGSQSIVVVIDARKTTDPGGYSVYTHNGAVARGLDPASLARRCAALGAGEIVVNSIDRDGEMNGYDFELVRQVRAATSLPMTVLGGAGSLDDIRALIDRFGIIGAAAGSLFVFKGKHRAVLINYPNMVEKERLFAMRPPA